MSAPHGTAPLPELVVKALGRIALVGLVIGGALIYLALRSPGPVDPAVTGVIGTFLAITSVAVGGLGAILSATRAVGSEPPQPVTIENEATDPVPTADVPAKRKRRRDDGHGGADFLVTVVALVVLVWLVTLLV